MATMPSPPGRFSTTTDWPHLACSLSANSRAPISTPPPGPSVTMSRTGRFGQVSAAACPVQNAGSRAIAASADNAHLALEFVVIGVLPPFGEAYIAKGSPENALFARDL